MSGLPPANWYSGYRELKRRRRSFRACAVFVLGASSGVIEFGRQDPKSKVQNTGPLHALKDGCRQSSGLVGMTDLFLGVLVKKVKPKIADKKKRGEWVELKFMAEAAESPAPVPGVPAW